MDNLTHNLFCRQDPFLVVRMVPTLKCLDTWVELHLLDQWQATTPWVPLMVIWEDPMAQAHPMAWEDLMVQDPMAQDPMARVGLTVRPDPMAREGLMVREDHMSQEGLTVQEDHTLQEDPTLQEGPAPSPIP